MASDRELALQMVRMLRNDLRMLLEMRCERHGVPGPGPAFSLCVVALIGCEVGGLLAAPPAKSALAATRHFLAWTGQLAGCDRYRSLAGPLVLFFRHGIAHSLLPLSHQMPSGRLVFSSTVWSQREGLQTYCAKWLRQAAEGQKQLSKLRKDAYHLRVRVSSGKSYLSVRPQVLAIDVELALKKIESALKTQSGPVWFNVSDNLGRFVAEVSSSKSFGKLLASETAILESGM